MRHDDGVSELDGQMLLGLGEAEEDADELFAGAEAAEADGAARRGGGALRALPRDGSRGRGGGVQPGELPSGGRAGGGGGAGAGAGAEARSGVRGGLVQPGRGGGGARAGGRRRAAISGRAIELDPDYADAVFNLAKLEFDAGELSAARRWWERYLELDPEVGVGADGGAGDPVRGLAARAGRRVTDFLLDGPEGAAVTVLLAHGAGAPMDSPAMTAAARALAAEGLRVARFEFGYMAGRRQGRAQAAAAGGDGDAGVSRGGGGARGVRAAGDRRQVHGRAGGEHGGGRAGGRGASLPRLSVPSAGAAGAAQDEASGGAARRRR